MRKFCSFLRGHAANVTNFEKERLLLLRKKSYNYINMHQSVTFAEKDLYKSFLKIKTIVKFETIAILQVNIVLTHSISNFRFNVPKK